MSDKPPGEPVRSRDVPARLSHRRSVQVSGGRATTRSAAHSARRRRPAAISLGYFVLLAFAASGIAIACQSAKDVRGGIALTGGTLLAAAGARLVLPEHLAGLLVTRRRVLDTMTFGLLGTGLLTIGLLLPPPY